MSSEVKRIALWPREVLGPPPGMKEICVTCWSILIFGILMPGIVALVVQARNGNLYGTTYGYRTNSTDLGAAFELTLGGTLAMLHTFNGPDSSNPVDALVPASNGNSCGTTSQGGSTTPWGLHSCTWVAHVREAAATMLRCI